VDIITDLHSDITQADFPLELPGVERLRELQGSVVTQIATNLLPRLKQQEGPALVVFGGSTGAGKSTLVNSLVGAEVSAAGVVRPTTMVPVLAVRPEDHWLVAAHPIAELAELTTAEAVPTGLGLLDAPDLDSVREENRQMGRLLLQTADLWVFVTTAARYGDALPWRSLTEAHERGTTIAVVLNRTPRDVLSEVRTDLLRRMSRSGLGQAPLFVIEDVGPHEGLLPPAAVSELRGWLHLLGGHHTARGLARRTAQGVWPALRQDLLDLADGITHQAMAAGTLRTLAQRITEEATEELVTRIKQGVAIQGAPTTRWLAEASFGGPLAVFTGGLQRVRRGWRDGAVARRSQAAAEIGTEVRLALAQVITDAAASAWQAVHEAWSRPERGAQRLLAGIEQPSPAQRHERVVAELEGWARRTENLAAQALTAAATNARVQRAINSVGLAGLLQGAVAGGDGPARALRYLFGSSGRQLIARVAADLHRIITASFTAEAASFLEPLDSLALRSNAGAGLRLRASELRGHL